MNFIKNGLSSVLIYGCGLVVVNGASFLMLPFYTRQFPPSEYALIILVLTCLPFTRYCLSLEICQAAPVFSSDDQTNSFLYISVGLWFTLLMNIVSYTIIGLANIFFEFTSLSSLELITLFILFIADSLFYYSSNILRWQLKPFLYNFITSGAAILEVVLTIVFILVLKLSIFGVFYSWLISRAAGFLITLIVTRHYYVFYFKLNTLKKMLSFSVPLVLSNLAYNLNRGFDRWILATFMGLSVVGIYGAGATIGGMINFIMASISAALIPIIYRSHERRDAPFDILKLFYIVITVCMVVAMFFALFNKNILNLLVTSLYYKELAHQPIVPIIVLAAIFSGLYVFSPGIAIKKKTSYVIGFNLCALTINFSLSFLLIQKLGMLGVAMAMLAGVVVNSSLYVVFSQRFYKLPFQLNHILMLLVIFSVSYAGGVWVGIQYSPFTLDSLLIRLFYWILFSFVSASLVWKICKDLQPTWVESRVSYETV